MLPVIMELEVPLSFTHLKINLRRKNEMKVGKYKVGKYKLIKKNLQRKKHKNDEVLIKIL